MAGDRRGFGRIEKLRSGRYRAAYIGPDKVLHRAPVTFQAKQDAEAWLSARYVEITQNVWAPTSGRKASQTRFGEYAQAWLENRPLKPRTRAHYESIYRSKLELTFADMELRNISPETVRAWHTTIAPGKPTIRAHAYGLLRSILATAVQDELISVNPAHIRGAGNSKRVHKIQPATLPELEQLVAAMPEKHQVMTLLAAWCGLRFGELTELRRKDIDQTNGIIRIKRAVARVKGEVVIGTPKSDAGTRDVAILPHLLPALKEHIEQHAEPGREGLLFAGAGGGHLAPSALYGRAATSRKAGWGFYGAREAAGRPDLRWHDLRHTGAVLAASTGATLAELMGRLGHSTPGAALRYQHAAQGRDMEIAKALSAMVIET